MRAILVLAASAAALVPVAASASVIDTHVTDVLVGRDGVVAFDTRVGNSQHPGCLPTDNNSVFRSTTDEGRSRLAALLTGQTNNRPVTIFGSDACATDGNTEDMTGIIIKP